MIDAGYPRPQTQIPVDGGDGHPRYHLDMGWDELMIAVEYDGDHHFADPVQVRYDIERSEYADRVGLDRHTSGGRHTPGRDPSAGPTSVAAPRLR